MRKYIFFPSLLLLCTLLGCQPKSGNISHIYIIATNDTHATIDATPALANLAAEYEQRGEVIIVDSGDRVSGNAYVDDATEPGVPMIELMNEIGYDVVTLGNHEFDRGPEVLRRMIEVADFEVVCANVTAKNGAPQPQPYTIIETTGIEIGFAGIVETSNGGHPLGSKSAYENFDFTEDIATAYDICDAVAEKCDFMVLLSHIGLEGDMLLAERKAKCDWIAGGHSHDKANREVCGIRITQGGKNIRSVAIADITVCEGAILGVEYSLVDMGDRESDAVLAERVERLKASDPALNSIEGRATSPATKDGVANFTISSLASYPYDGGFVPEVTFYHYGGIRIEGFEEEIKRVEILNNDPFHSTIYIGTLTTEQMRDFILKKYNSGSTEHPDKESHYPYFRSDATYRIILSNEPADNPDATAIEFDLREGEYRVAMCNYIAENYIDSAIVARQLRPTGITVREAMFRHIRSYAPEGFTPDNECHQREIRK